MRLFISFSARNNGNCDELIKYLAKEEDKIIYFRDLSIHSCRNCDYECFDNCCKYRDDDIYSLYEDMQNYQKIVLIVPIDLSGGYEEVRYVANYDYIDDEPQMLICGVASTYIEAMNLVNMPALITFEDNLPSTITYHKTNRETEVFYSYDYKEYSRIAVTAIISDIEYNIKSFADKYIDTDLYVYNKTESIISDSLEADYYICYKNDEDINMAYVITSYEVNDVTCYYMIHFDLYNGEASDSIEEIVNTMSIIYN